MDFVTDLPISADKKGDSYNLILVIVNWLTKMVYYKPVKVTIIVLGLAKLIINVIMRHHRVSKSIVIDQGSPFISKFLFLLWYFLDIKKKLSTAFHLLTDSWTKRQNRKVEAYLKAFVNWKQADLARLLLMAEFAYNNAKNASTRHTLFKLNCDYHPRVFFEEDVDFCSKSRSTNELIKELRELIEVCYQNFFYAEKL